MRRRIRLGDKVRAGFVVFGSVGAEFDGCQVEVATIIVTKLKPKKDLWLKPYFWAWLSLCDLITWVSAGVAEVYGPGTSRNVRFLQEAIGFTSPRHCSWLLAFASWREMYGPHGAGLVKAGGCVLFGVEF